MRTPCDRAVPYTAELDCKEHAAMHPARKIFLGKVSQERGDCPRLFQEERTGAPNRYQARMALYALRKLYHSKELSPLLSLCRSLSRGSIISLYWSLRRLTHLGSNLPGLLPTRHCDMQRRILRTNSSGFKAEKYAKRWRSIAITLVSFP